MVERKLWISLGIFLSVSLVLTALVPSVFADTGGGTDDRVYAERFLEIFRAIRSDYVDEMDPETLFQGALDGMFEILDDPHSYYLTESDLESFSEDLAGMFSGVGIYISKPAKEEIGADEPAYIEVIAPIEGTPAYKAGISAGDFITHVNGQPTEDLNIDQVVDMIRGIPGTPVTLTIKRGKTLSFDLEILRSNIEVPTVKYAMIDNRIAYIKIIRFNSLTEEQVLKAAEFFTTMGYDSMIVDLRNNPGGLLSSVVDVSNLFLSSQVIVSTRGRLPQKNEVYRARRSHVFPLDIPIVVLINKGSASAAEILAGALRDNNRAILVGETSFGKGSVQEIRTIDEGGYKLTIARYYTPSGADIDRVGIEPDRVVEEPVLTDDEAASLERLTQENLIRDFTDRHMALPQTCK